MNLPTLENSFTSDLNLITITGASASVSFSLTDAENGTAILYGENYIPNSAGEILIYDIGTVLEKYLTDKAGSGVFSENRITQKQFTFSFSGSTQTILVAYCPAEIGAAYDVVESFFYLSALNGNKRTRATCKEELFFYATSAPSTSVKAKYIDTTGEFTFQTFTLTPVNIHNRLYYIECSPENFVVFGKTLIQYQVITGSRLRMYVLDYNSYFAVNQFVFINSFGVPETLYFVGEKSSEDNFERTFGYTAAGYIQTGLNPVNNLKVDTGVISQSEAEWVFDFFYSPYIYVFLNRTSFSRQYQSIMTGNDKKIVGAEWTSENINLKFSPTTYNADGTTTASNKDNLVLSIEDASPTLDPKSISPTEYINIGSGNVGSGAYSGTMSGTVSYYKFHDQQVTDYAVSSTTSTPSTSITITTSRISRFYGNLKFFLYERDIDHGIFTFSSGYVTIHKPDGTTAVVTISSSMVTSVNSGVALFFNIPYDCTSSGAGTWAIDFSISFSCTASGQTEAYYYISDNVSTSMGGVAFSVNAQHLDFPAYIYYRLAVITDTGTLSFLCTKQNVASDNLYIFSLDFENIFSALSSQQVTFKIYKIGVSDVETLISTASFYYIYDSTFVDTSTRAYDGRPFYNHDKIILVQTSTIDKRLITILEEEIKRSSLPDELPRYNFTYRLAQQNQRVFQLKKHVRIFDKKFDTIFD